MKRKQNYADRFLPINVSPYHIRMLEIGKTLENGALMVIMVT